MYFRVRCVLPDDKNSAKDLKFCPTQEFDTLDEAKHCAALLAFKYIEPQRPLERKLPDPYRELWLAMAMPAEDAAAKKGFVSKKAAAIAARKASAPAVPVLTAAPYAGSDDEDAMNLWGNTPDPPVADAKPIKKFPVELTLDRQFASQAEFEKAKLERQQERNKKQRQRENRERANLHKQVFMSAACRDMIEQVLRTLGTITSASGVGDDGNGDADAVDDDADAADEGKVARDEFYERVSKQLRKIGFQQTHVQGALQACKRDSDHSDDEFMTIIFDWLCLNVPEGDLPKGFNPEGTQLDVVLTAGDKNSKSQDKQTAMSPVLMQRLMKYGYDRRDAIVVANGYLRTHLDDAGNESPSPEIMFALLQELYPHQLKHFEVDVTKAEDGTLPDDEEIAAQRQDELLALEAIYDDKFEAQVLPNEEMQLLLLQVSDDVQLEIFLQGTSKYPFELPIIGLTSTNPALTPFLLFTCGSVLKSCAGMLGEPMIYEICVAVDTILGECAKKSKAPKIVLLPHASAKKEPKRATPPPAPVSALAGGGKQDKKKGNNQQTKKPKKRQNGNFEKKVDVEAVKRMSDKLFQLRQSKDSKPEFQQMQRARAKLPAAAEKENVVQYLKHNQVVLVCGATGCGKTTQVPQFILDEYIDSNRGGECQIICTQPRRIAAIGVATRVAQERCEEIADIVGYQIRMDAKKSANTRLLFCTTGVLLRRLLSDRLLSGVCSYFYCDLTCCTW